MIYILGFKGFIARHLYLVLKKDYSKIVLLSHGEINQLKNVTSDDVVINCCGVNKSSSKEDYDKGNFHFVDQLLEYLGEFPYLIHLSSLMVYGFQDIPTEQLADYQKWFIKSKLKGECSLMSKYKQNLCIIRPSNVYGYDCKPYYNNLLSTMVYEKIKGLKKINCLNKNCVRNMISVRGLVSEISTILTEKRTGFYNIVSSNDLSLDQMVNELYDSVPDYMEINDGERSVLNINNYIPGEYIRREEDFTVEISKLEREMRCYYELLDKINIDQRKYLQQPRGDMVEITALESKRLYKITITQNSVRGNHYHYKQIEDFYINSGKVLFLLALDTAPEVIHVFVGYKNDLITINPLVIHTVSNEFLNNIPEIIISSTQEYIPNEIPDTKYVNLL